MATEAPTKTPTKTPITMTDGRVVEFTNKQRLAKESTINEAEGTVSTRLDFRNGETRTFVVPAALTLKFVAHGVEQKLGDAIAGEKDDGDAVLAVDDLITRLSKGEWTAARKEGGFTGASTLLKALVEVTGKTPDGIKTYLDGKSQAEKLALRKSDRLAPVIAKLEAEKAKNSKTPTVDTDSLFGELDAITPAAPAAKSKAA